jgi:hypothetical protein
VVPAVGLEVVALIGNCCRDSTLPARSRGSSLILSVVVNLQQSMTRGQGLDIIAANWATAGEGGLIQHHQGENY